MPEMDKARDVRRGASRFSPAKRQIKQSGHKLFSGLDGGRDTVSTEKSKKERLRKLSSVVRASSSYEECEMGCVGSFGNDELRPQGPSPISSSKRFKLPKGFFDDCNSVDHSPVPRKLRSAMKKRSRESISPPLPDSKKLNHTIDGVESTRKDGVKKYKANRKQGSSDWSPRRANSGPITKEEEEVVETLYALAGMLPNDDMTDKCKLEGEFCEAKPTALPETEERPTPTFEVLKDNTESISPSIAAEAANPPSSVERSIPGETTEVNSLSEPCVLEQPNSADRKQSSIELNSSAPPMNLQVMPLLSKSESADEKPTCISVNFGTPSRLETGLKQPKQQDAPPFERKPEIAFSPATAVRSQQEQPHAIKEDKKNGPSLWPGLSSTGSHGCGSNGPSLQFYNAKTPAWLDTATCATRPGSSENGISIEKVSGVTVDRKSWKRCAAHVYISRLIQVLQISERKERLPIQPNQLRPSEALERGVSMVANNLNGVRNGLNGVLSAGMINSSYADKNSNEARNSILLHNRLHQNQQWAAQASAGYTLQNQSFDFLSLSAGTVEASSSTASRAGNGLGQLSQLPVPYLHSLAQHHTFVPLSLSQTCYSSSPYPDQLSSTTAAQQVQLQLPPYLSPLCGPPHLSPPASTKQQQQQQRIWAAQLATLYRPGGTTSPMAQFPSWQGGRQDSPLLAQCAQAMLPPSPSSLEVLGPKYISISPQQHQFMAITSSLPPVSSSFITKTAPKVKRQHHHLPSGFEENGGGFHSDGALPLQLLCNEHL